MISRDDVRTGRRAGAVAGVTGLAVALGLGAYFAAGGSTAPTATDRTIPAGSSTVSPGTGGEGPAPAMTPTPQPTSSVPKSFEETQRGSLKSGGIVRVVSARSDLSGQGELQWVAGGVEPYRNAECTQRFQLGNEPKPARKPNLLLCWRTSAKKSVIAVLVDPKGKPSKAKAVGELDKKWRAMG